MQKKKTQQTALASYGKCNITGIGFTSIITFRLVTSMVSVYHFVVVVI